MSSYVRIAERCAVCGGVSEQEVLVSCSRFGSPDLDLRPPEMIRTAMLHVHRCPYCGYVAGKLDAPTRITPAWIAQMRERFRAHYAFADQRAGLFFWQYMIALEDRDPEAAFHAALTAAWVCDDARDKDAAQFCRLRALEPLEQLIALHPEVEEYRLQRVDILRRAGEFRKALVACDVLHLKDKELQSLVDFERRRAARGDTRCYTVDEAKKWRIRLFGKRG